MKNEIKIKFVRMYKMYREDWFDVVYKSGRIHTYAGAHNLPKTALEYVEKASKRTEQHDKVFNRSEMIYEA